MAHPGAGCARRAAGAAARAGALAAGLPLPARLRRPPRADPQVVGACLEDGHHNPANGAALQRTSGGLLVWRKSDSFTAFADGHWTWVNGPSGLQRRLNGERFAWENDPVEPVDGAVAPPRREGWQVFVGGGAFSASRARDPEYHQAP